MISSKGKKEQIFGRGAKASLLFASLLGAQPISETASNLLSITKSQKEILFSKHSEIEGAGTWSPILRQSQGEQSISLTKFSGSVSAVSISDWGGFGIAGDGYSFTGTAQLKPSSGSSPMKIDAVQNTGSFRAAVWSSGKPVQAGFEAGVFTVDTVLRDSTDDFRNRSLPISLKASIFGERHRFFGAAQFERSPALLSSPRLTSVNSGNQRSIPLASVRHTAEFTAGTVLKSVKLAGEAGFSLVQPAPFAAGVHALPGKFTAKAVTAGFSGRSDRFAGAVRWKRGVGSAESYDGTDQISRWIRFESGTIQRISPEFSYTGNRLSGKCFGELLQFRQDSTGSADFYPFSAWTLFKPKAFRFKDGTARAVQVGIIGSGKHRWNSRQSTSWSLGESFIDAEGSVMRETKKIAVLIPVYVDDTVLTGNSRILLTDLTLAHQASIGKAVLKGSARQLIPITLSRAEHSSETGSGTSSAPDDQHLFGGLTLNLSCTVPIEQFRRKRKG